MESSSILLRFPSCTNVYEPRSDKRDLLAVKVKSEIFTEKERLAVVNNYRKFEENYLYK